jgi:hypothetical protein
MKEMVMAKKKTTKKSYLTGRNRYPQKCVVCGEMVPTGAGFLKKRPKGFTGYEVIHEECKSVEKEVEKEFVGSSILQTLEAKLIQRQMNGEPVILLPQIIEHIKELEFRIASLEK